MVALLGLGMGMGIGLGLGIELGLGLGMGLGIGLGMGLLIDPIPIDLVGTQAVVQVQVADLARALLVQRLAVGRLMGQG